ncbi:hypothetical protein SAMN02745146_3096 [Hymenobacter daecheongensis DSM 21074]|uniref:Uncharacterized protein n=1 Tax=Hymenobacter daecheongensis DSM 21074 TaxID=1121955 RepID=A0A1M6J4N0_9BACT|nr:hypothetical protein [Hymenobacter daecheongensis]SHJ41665.1 hypothetical protein SAMN02745146_3096 [Hymenobacter daecheongensis DSM 21074]
MKRFLLPAFLIAALLSAPATSQASSSDGPGRKKARTAKALKKQTPAAPKSTSAANWGSATDDDALWATPAPEAVSAPVAAEPALNDDPAMRSSGVMIAPGMNTAPYRGVSTDYNGRPLKKAAKKATVAAVPVEAELAADDPMMRSSGVMIAPGMNTAPYRGVSTDYHGRPLKKKASKASTLAVQEAQAPAAMVATAEVPEW